MAASDAQSMSGEAILLQDFVETFKLPKISEVVGGEGLSGAPFSSGDSLMLRTLAVESVGLRFYDADAGSRREVRVPVDNSFKFHVVQDYNSATPKVYPTVADLLSDCPTVFKANTEVTTKNGRTLQRGSVLNFVRKTRSLTDRCVFLECRDSAGTHHLLPLSSRGDFTIVHDPSSYTLQEIISLGAVERILRLSNENKKFAVVNDGSQHAENDFARHLPVYDNVQNKDAALSRITGLPLTFKGNIYMQRPELFLLSSPANDMDVRWKIALDSNLYFLVPEEERSVEYQEPIKPNLVLKEFVEEFEQDFPVIARLGSCEELQNKFKEYLSDNMEVLVHRVDKVEKILCNISGDKFCVSDRVKGRLRKSLTRFKSLSELISQGLNQEEVAIKMMEDIASDVPEPFSLKAGDVVIFKSFNVSTVNIKVGKKSYEKCQVILCEKVLEDETKQKLQLPLDLEADFIQLPSPGEESGFDINVVLSKSINLPLTVDFIPTTNTETCLLPTDCEITIENVVIDSLVVISPLPHRENRESGLSARLKFCLLLPLRSDITLRLEEKLQFPSNYFIFPRRHKWIEELEVERLSDGEYGYMTKYNDSAYEDYAFRQSFSECNITEYVSGKTSKKKSKKLKKKNRSVTELELDKIDLQKVASSPGRLTSGSEPDISQHATKNDTRADDENIYETFDPGKKRRERRKSDTSLRSRIKRRVSRIF